MPRRPLSDAVEGTQQRGLPRTVAAHEGDDLAFGEREVDVPHRRDAPVPNVQTAHLEHRLPGGPEDRPGRAPSRAFGAAPPPDGGRRGPRGRAGPTRGSDPGRQPVGRTPSRASTSAGGPTVTVPDSRLSSRSAYSTTRSSRCSAASTVTPTSCTRRSSEERISSAATGSSAEVGSSRTRMRGLPVSTDSDRDPLLLSSGESRQRPAAQVRDTEQVEGLLDAAAHHRGLDRELLHHVGELFLDHVGDEARLRVLPDVADDVGQLARAEVPGVTPFGLHAALDVTAGEVGDEAVDGAQQARLARAGASRSPARSRPRERGGRRRRGRAGPRRDR